MAPCHSRYQGPVGPMDPMRHGPRLDDAPSCSSRFVYRGTSVPSCCVSNRCQGLIMNHEAWSQGQLGPGGSMAAVVAGYLVVKADEPAWFLVAQGITFPFRPRRHAPRWTGSSLASCHRADLDNGIRLMPGHLPHQDVRISMAYWSRCDRLALRPWNRLLREIKSPMRMVGHGL